MTHRTPTGPEPKPAERIVNTPARSADGGNTKVCGSIHFNENGRLKSYQTPTGEILNPSEESQSDQYKVEHDYGVEWRNANLLLKNYLEDELLWLCTDYNFDNLEQRGERISFDRLFKIWTNHASTERYYEKRKKTIIRKTFDDPKSINVYEAFYIATHSLPPLDWISEAKFPFGTKDIGDFLEYAGGPSKGRPKNTSPYKSRKEKAGPKPNEDKTWSKAYKPNVVPLPNLAISHHLLFLFKSVCEHDCKSRRYKNNKKEKTLYQFNNPKGLIPHAGVHLVRMTTKKEFEKCVKTRQFTNQDCLVYNGQVEIRKDGKPWIKFLSGFSGATMTWLAGYFRMVVRGELKTVKQKLTAKGLTRSQIIWKISFYEYCHRGCEYHVTKDLDDQVLGHGECLGRCFPHSCIAWRHGFLSTREVNTINKTCDGYLFVIGEDGVGHIFCVCQCDKHEDNLCGIKCLELTKLDLRKGSLGAKNFNKALLPVAVSSSASEIATSSAGPSDVSTAASAPGKRKRADSDSDSGESESSKQSKTSDAKPSPVKESGEHQVDLSDTTDCELRDTTDEDESDFESDSEDPIIDLGDIASPSPPSLDSSVAGTNSSRRSSRERANVSYREAPLPSMNVKDAVPDWRFKIGSRVLQTTERGDLDLDFLEGTVTSRHIHNEPCKRGSPRYMVKFGNAEPRAMTEDALIDARLLRPNKNS